MRAVSISASHPYEVRIGSGLLSDLGAQLRGLFAAPRSVMVVSDDTVSALYGPAAERSLREQLAHLDCPRDPMRACEHDLAAGQKHNVRVDTHGLAR